jgi:hypothetical protein
LEVGREAGYVSRRSKAISEFVTANRTGRTVTRRRALVKRDPALDHDRGDVDPFVGDPRVSLAGESVKAEVMRRSAGLPDGLPNVRPAFSWRRHDVDRHDGRHVGEMR